MTQTTNSQSSKSATPKMAPPASGPLAALETTFYDWLVTKAPFQLPPNAVDMIVKYSPWIILVLGVLSLPLIFALLGLGAIVGGIAAITGVYVGFLWTAMLVLVAQIVVMFVSVPMLMKRQRKGWLLVFYVDLLNAAYDLLHGLSYGVGGLFGQIIPVAISLAIGMYILFQIRRAYVN